MLESDIGTCPFCNGTSVDLIEEASTHYWFGCLSSGETVERLALCQSCGRSVREVHFQHRKKEGVPHAKVVSPDDVAEDGESIPIVGQSVV